MLNYILIPRRGSVYQGAYNSRESVTAKACCAYFEKIYNRSFRYVRVFFFLLVRDTGKLLDFPLVRDTGKLLDSNFQA